MVNQATKVVYNTDHWQDHKLEIKGLVQFRPKSTLMHQFKKVLKKEKILGAIKTNHNKTNKWQTQISIYRKLKNKVWTNTILSRTRHQIFQKNLLNWLKTVFEEKINQLGS